MTPQPNMNASPKESLRALRIFCAALIAGVCLFTIIILGLYMGHILLPVVDAQTDTILMSVTAALAVACLFIALRSYNNSITSAKDSLNALNDKLDAYRPALIRYMATCEMPALLSVIVYFLSGDYLVLMVTAVMLLAMFARFPITKRVISDLGLGSQDGQELE